MLLRSLRNFFGLPTTTTTTYAVRGQDRSFRGGTDASPRINFNAQKTTLAMQFAKFPFAEAYARLQLHYSSCNARQHRAEGRSGKKLRAAFASSSAVQGCINLALSLHSVTPFLSPLTTSFLHQPAALAAPVFPRTLNSVVLSAVPLFCNAGYFNADRETDMHRYCIAWLCCCV